MSKAKKAKVELTGNAGIGWWWSLNQGTERICASPYNCRMTRRLALRHFQRTQKLIANAEVEHERD